MNENMTFWLTAITSERPCTTKIAMNLREKRKMMEKRCNNQHIATYFDERIGIGFIVHFKWKHETTARLRFPLNWEIKKFSFASNAPESDTKWMIFFKNLTKGNLNRVVAAFNHFYKIHFHPVNRRAHRNSKVF